MSQAVYFRRAIHQSAGGIALDPEFIVYRIERAPGARQDPVPAVGAFPPNWRPLDSSPGVVNFDRLADRPVVIPCWLERSSLKHFEPLTETKALALVPALGSPIERAD